jgi:hypothetical protein
MEAIKELVTDILNDKESPTFHKLQQFLLLQFSFCLYGDQFGLTKSVYRSWIVART